MQISPPSYIPRLPFFFFFFFFGLLCCSLKNDLCWRKWHRSVLFSCNIKAPNEKYTFLKRLGLSAILSYFFFSLCVSTYFQSDTSYEQQRGSISAGKEPLPRETNARPPPRKKAKDKRNEHVYGKQTRGSLSRLICKSLWLIEMYNKCWWD